jgi:putrescine aminotransferase
LNKHGILTSYCDLDPSVLRFEPPLIVTEEQIDAAVDAIEEVLGHGVGGLALSLGKSLVERALGHAGKPTA